MHLAALPRLALATLLVAACTHRGIDTSSSPIRAPSDVRVTFVADSPQFVADARAYEAIWSREGPRIVAAMERATGIRFDDPPYADTAIGAVVIELPSNSGHRERPMRLRASYPEATKRATLVHELGHRLQTGVARGADEHEVLFLWLYDAWVSLWGQEFADAQVAVETARRGVYPRAWDAALALDAAGRAERFRRLRAAAPSGAARR